MANIIVGDNLTTLEFTINDQDGKVDLSSAKEVKFRMKKQGQYVEKVATINDAVNGVCQLKLSNTDTDRQGNFSYQITVEFLDGSLFSSDTKYLVISAKL